MTTHKTTADAVIIGGGVMGASILYNLADLGLTNTLLLEKDILGSGSTSRSVAILRMHYSNDVTCLLAWKSLSIFKNFEELIGSPSGYTQTGYFAIAKNESDKIAMAKNVKKHQDLGIASRLISVEDARELAPMVHFDEDENMTYESESGYADPYMVTTGYARRARELGAIIQDSTEVTGIDISGGKVRGVITPDGRIATPVAVDATGPWSGPFLKNLGVDIPLRTVRHQVAIIRRPQDLLPEHPAIGDITNHISTRPDIGHRTLLGVSDEDSPGPSEYNQGVDMAAVEKAFSALSNRIPAMSNAFFQGGWSGLYTVTPDWHQVLDKVEDVDGLYCAVGLSGHGFKESPMIGKSMSELIVHGKSETVDISQLNMHRFQTGELMKSSYDMPVLA